MCVCVCVCVCQEIATGHFGVLSIIPFWLSTIKMSLDVTNDYFIPLLPLARLAWAVEDTDCFSAEGLTPHPNECPGYHTKQSDAEVPVMLELRGMWSTPTLPSLPGPIWPGVVAPNRVLSMS